MGQGKERTDKTLDPWLLKRLGNRYLLPTILHTENQLGQLNASSSSLARWVRDRSRLASTISRAIHLPLLSRALDSIRKKTSLVPTVWQHALDLPWPRQSHRQRMGFNKTMSNIEYEEPSNKTSLQKERYPNMLAQTFHYAEEQRLPDGTDEAHPSLPSNNQEEPSHPADKVYPSVIENLSLSPLDRKEAPSTVHRLFGRAPTTSKSFNTKNIADTHYSNDIGQGLHIMRRKRLAHTVDVAYPSIIRNLFSAATAREGVHGTPLTIGTKRETGEMKIQDGDNFVSSSGDKIGIPIKNSQENEIRVNRQPDTVKQSRSMSLLFTPITQRTALQRKPLAISHLDADKEMVRKEELISKMAGQPISLLPVNMSEDVSKRTPQPVIPGVKNEPNDMVSDSMSNMKKISDKGFEIPLRGVTPHRTSEVIPIRTEKPIINRQIRQLQQKAVADRSLNLNIPDSISQKQSMMDRTFINLPTNNPLFYKQSLPISIAAIKSPPVAENISRMTTTTFQQHFKSEAHIPVSNNIEYHEYTRSLGNAASSLINRSVYQPALQMPIASPTHRKVEASAASNEGLFRFTPDITQTSINPRNNGFPELALAPITRAPEESTTSQAAASASIATTSQSRAEESGEQGAVVDIRSLAREIYPVIKRMIMVERERRAI